MALFINPTGQPTFGIGVCARCWCKFPLADLYPDPNSPGLKVCLNDLDDYDPYRLPARRTENIALPFYRPDERLSIEESTPAVGLFGVRSTPEGNIRVTLNGNRRTIVDIPEIDEN